MATKIRIEMVEIMLISGVYLFNHSKYLSLTLIILSIVAGVIRYSIEKTAKDSTEESNRKLLKDFYDKAASSLSQEKSLIFSSPDIKNNIIN